MHKLITILLFIIVFIFSVQAQEGVSINEDGSTADNSAILDVKSTSKGVLLPRVNLVSTASQSPIASTPAVRLLVFNLATSNDVVPGFYFWNGSAWQSINAASSSIPTYRSGTVHCNSTPTIISDIVSTTGKTWMDRNLGADQVATSYNDNDAYGDMYQWGRFADGHQCRSSATVSTSSNGDDPGHGDFILNNNDWRTTNNDNLWQGVNGINNPCPTGYRLPSTAELDAERLEWATNDVAGAYGSILKFTAGGRKFASTGGLNNMQTNGYYWTSNINGQTRADYLYTSVYNTGAAVNSYSRASGFSVRCIKD